MENRRGIIKIKYYTTKERYETSKLRTFKYYTLQKLKDLHESGVVKSHKHYTAAVITLTDQMGRMGWIRKGVDYAEGVSPFIQVESSQRLLSKAIGRDGTDVGMKILLEHGILEVVKEHYHVPGFKWLSHSRILAIHIDQDEVLEVSSEDLSQKHVHNYENWINENKKDHSVKSKAPVINDHQMKDMREMLKTVSLVYKKVRTYVPYNMKEDDYHEFVEEFEQFLIKFQTKHLYSYWFRRVAAERKTRLPLPNSLSPPIYKEVA